MKITDYGLWFIHRHSGRAEQSLSCFGRPKFLSVEIYYNGKVIGYSETNHRPKKWASSVLFRLNLKKLGIKLKWDRDYLLNVNLSVQARFLTYEDFEKISEENR